MSHANAHRQARSRYLERLMLRRALILLVLALTFAAGCGDDDESSATTTGDSEAAAESTITDPAETDEPDEKPEDEARPGDEAELGPDESAELPPEQSDAGAEALSRGEVRRVIRRFVTARDPSDCELATERLLNRSLGGLEGCRNLTLQGAGASDVEFNTIKLAGAEAEAEIVPIGGAANGLAIRIRVIRVDGQPRLDAFEAPGVAPGP